MQTVTYRMDKQQGLTGEHRELYSIFWCKLMEENLKKLKKNLIKIKIKSPVMIKKTPHISAFICLCF